MAAIARESCSCSSPMSWHCSAEVGFLASCKVPARIQQVINADDSVWWSHTGSFPGIWYGTHWFVGYHWRQYLPYWRSGSPYGLLLATSPVASTCPFSGHDPSLNGSSAVSLPLPSTTVCFFFSCWRTSSTRWQSGGISSTCLQTVLVEVGHYASTALLPNRTTESFQMEAGPPYDTESKGFKWGCVKEILCLYTSGVELSTTNVSW